MAEVMIPWDHYEAPYFLLAKPISRIACLQQSDGLNVLLWSRSFHPAVGSTWLPAAIGESDSLWVPERHPTSVSSAFYTYTTTWGKLKHAWLGFDTNNSPNCGILFPYHSILVISLYNIYHFVFQGFSHDFGIPQVEGDFAPHIRTAVASRRTVCFLVSWHHWKPMLDDKPWEYQHISTSNHEGYQPSTTRYENLWNILKHASFEICWNQSGRCDTVCGVPEIDDWAGMGFLPECFKRSIWCSIRLQSSMSKGSPWYAKLRPRRSRKLPIAGNEKPNK